MYDLSVIREMVKYTAPFAGVGTVYVQANLGARTGFLGISGDWVWAHGWTVAETTAIASYVILVAFIVCTVFGVWTVGATFGISQLESFITHEKSKTAVERAARKSAGDKSQPASNVKIEDWKTRIRNREKGAIFLAKWHIRLLWVGFIGAALLYVDDRIDPEAAAKTCALKRTAEGTITIPLDCIPEEEDEDA